MSQFMKIKPTVSIAAWMVLFGVHPLQAYPLTVGKGSGIIWEGESFNETLSNQYPGANFQEYTVTLTRGGVASISNSTTDCLLSSALSVIDGVQAFPIASGIGLVPVTNVSVTSQTSGFGPAASLSGTIGLDGTQGNSAAIIPTNTTWCFSFANYGVAFPFSVRGSSNQTAIFSGKWVIVADGTQQTGTYPLPPMYALSYAAEAISTKTILRYTTLRVTNIACSIATTTNVNFGAAARNVTEFAELANYTAPLTVTCNQDMPDTIDTNINVQFSGNLFGARGSRLALSQGGGYITGEISNGVTGSGACNATTGVNFNGTDISVGTLGASALNQTFPNQITWRLCSGGSSLPTGPVTASVNVAVTYN